MGDTTNQLIVLLADDDADDRMFFEEAVMEVRFDVHLTMVKDGSCLMEYLLHEAVMLPHVLFLDLNMPFKNGIQCLEEIRSNHTFNDICIIIFSTTARQADIDACYNGGANLFIHKPNSFTDLKMILTKAFELGLDKCHKPTREEFFLKL